MFGREKESKVTKIGSDDKIRDSATNFFPFISRKWNYNFFHAFRFFLFNFSLVNLSFFSPIFLSCFSSIFPSFFSPIFHFQFQSHFLSSFSLFLFSSSSYFSSFMFLMLIKKLLKLNVNLMYVFLNPKCN